MTGQPGFIYADDIDEYVSDRGALMFALDEIPFSVARNNDELVGNVLGSMRKSMRRSGERLSRK